MSREIFVTSDSHFQHANILKFVDDDGKPFRTFKGVDEMDEHMIERWNSVVREQDHVWHLGDVTFGSYDRFENEILPRLRGKISVVLGNHDDVRKLCAMKRFRNVALQRRFDEFGLYMTHIPLERSSFFNHRLGKQMKNVHGHIHVHKSPNDVDYANVSVEVTGYVPVNIEQLRIW